MLRLGSIQHLSFSNRHSKLVAHDGPFVWLYDKIRDVDDATTPLLHLYSLVRSLRMRCMHATLSREIINLFSTVVRRLSEEKISNLDMSSGMVRVRGSRVKRGYSTAGVSTVTPLMSCSGRTPYLPLTSNSFHVSKIHTENKAKSRSRGLFLRRTIEKITRCFGWTRVEALSIETHAGFCICACAVLDCVQSGTRDLLQHVLLDHVLQLFRPMMIILCPIL